MIPNILRELRSHEITVPRKHKAFEIRGIPGTQIPALNIKHENTAVSTSVPVLQMIYTSPREAGKQQTDGPDRPSSEKLHTTHAARELSRHGE